MTYPVTITLSWPEVNAACQVAQFRKVHNHMRGFGPRYGAPNDFCDSIAFDLRGCLGEIAVAKHFNLYWSGVIDMNAPDVGFSVEVRARKNLPLRQLILHNEDEDEKPFVHAKVGINPTNVLLIGWIIAKDGKNKDFWNDPAKGRPAYFVPDHALRPMAELKEWLAVQSK